MNLNKNIIMERKKNMKKSVLLAVLAAMVAIGGCGTVNNKVVSQKNDKTNVCIMKKIYIFDKSKYKGIY